MSISVVVPVYNTGFYVADCLDSILAQDIVDMEIIVINDCSNDNSGEIIDAYAKKDTRIRVVHLTKNIGLGPVRNKGIELASGQWICWIDSDDIMQPNALFALSSAAEMNGSDIVIGQVERQIDNEDGSFNIREFTTSRYLRFNVANTNLNNCPSLINITSSCSILFSRKFLISNEIRFLRRFQEDHDFVLWVILEANKVSIQGDVLFFRYRARNINRRGGSASLTQSDWTAERFGMMVDHLMFVVDLLTDKKYSKKLQNFEYFQITRFSYYLGTFVNNILKQVFLSKNLNEFYPHLERLSGVFNRSKLQETGLNTKAESLAYNPALSESGFYELALCLIIERDWNTLKSLLCHNAFDVRVASRLLARESLSKRTHEALLYFIKKWDRALIPLKNQLPRLLPHHVDDVLIHIGMTKTGSTAIQNYLELNRGELLARKILYPSAGVYYEGRNNAKRTAGHQELINSSRKNDGNLFERIKIEAESSAATKLILSAENYFHADYELVEQLKRSLGNVNLKIVLYLRRQDKWLESYYAEVVSGSHHKTTENFENFVNNYDSIYLNYFDRLKRWSNIFGEENIIVRPYVKDILNGGVVEDFCKIADLEEIAAYQQIGVMESNISPLSRDDLILLRQMNSLPFSHTDSGYRPFIHAFVDQFGSNTNPRGIHWFKDNERQKLMDKYEEGNRLISEKYLNGQPLFSSPTAEEINADQLNVDENISIPSKKLKITMDLYHQFYNKGPDVNLASEQLRDQYSRDFDKVFRQGCAAFHAAKYEEAVLYFSKARVLQPNHVPLRRVLAETLISQGRLKEAIPHLKKAQELRPGNKLIERQLLKSRHPFLSFMLKHKPFVVPYKERTY